MVQSLNQILLSLPSLSSSEEKVAKWVISNANKLPTMSMGQVAIACGVSDTSVLRFCRSVGFQGFTDLKFRLVEGGVLQNDNEDSVKRLVAEPGSGPVASFFEDCIQGLRDSERRISESFDSALDAIESASEILLVGVGTSRPIIESARLQFSRLGLRCRSQSDSYLQLMDVVQLRPDALVVGISYSGSSADPVKTMQLAKERGLSTLCITGMPGSPITHFADVVVSLGVQELRPEPVIGRIVQFAAVACLARGWAERYPIPAAIAEVNAFEAVIEKTL